MSALEDTLLFQITAAGLPIPVREYRAIPGRRYRWDFAWVQYRLLAECQGSTYVPNTGHTSGKGIARDADKLNNATLHGWRQLTFTATMIKSGEALQMIEQALKGSEE